MGVAELRVLLPACRAALTSCVDDETEMQQVRKLAVSLLARLPPGESAELMWSRLRRVADEPLQYGPQPCSALALFYICCAVSLYPDVAAAAGDESHASILITILSTPTREEAFHRLQQGAVDCLARVLCAPLIAPANGTLAVESSALKTRLLTMLDTPTSTALTLAVVGVAVRMLHANGGAAVVAPLAEAWIPALLTRDGPAITHALFELAFHCQQAPAVLGQHTAALLQRARIDVSAADVPTRLAGLKLLGVLLSSGISSLQSIGEGDEPVALLRMLHKLAQGDESDKVRALAQALVRTAVGEALS